MAEDSRGAAADAFNSGLGEFAEGIPMLNLIFGPMSRGLKADALRQQLEQMKLRFQNLPLPQYSSDTLTPVDVEFEKYGRPDEAQYKLPELDPRIREMQLSALNNIQDQYSGYGASVSEAERRNAIMDSQRMARGRDEAALAQAQARGVGGSGLEFALRQQGGQDAANRGMQGGLAAAQQAALARLQGSQAYQQGVGSYRNQEQALAGQSADIINQFNMANTQARNRQGALNTELSNRSRQYGADNRNQARQFNVNRGDRHADSLYNAALQRLSGEYGVTKDMVGLGERKNVRDTEQARENEKQWARLFSMAGGAGGGGGGMGGMGGMGGGGGFNMGSMFGG